MVEVYTKYMQKRRLSSSSTEHIKLNAFGTEVVNFLVLTYLINF